MEEVAQFLTQSKHQKNKKERKKERNQRELIHSMQGAGLEL